MLHCLTKTIHGVRATCNVKKNLSNNNGGVKYLEGGLDRDLKNKQDERSDLCLYKFITLISRTPMLRSERKQKRREKKNLSQVATKTQKTVCKLEGLISARGQR